MSKVMYKLIKSFVVCMFLFGNSAYADFTQNKTRYLSYYDIVNHFEKLGLGDQDCSKPLRKNMTINGYSSPITGKPINTKPNFDFINAFYSCLLGFNQFEASNFIGEDLYNEFRRQTNDYSDEDTALIQSGVEAMILKLIGPEVVLVSYGFTTSLEAFRNEIIISAKEMTNKNDDKSIDEFFKNVFNLIHLRDEFLSY